VEDRELERMILSNLGLVYYKSGNKQQALSCYKQAVHTAREVGDGGGEGGALWVIGELYFNRHPDVALACFLLAREIFERAQSPDRDKVQRRIDNLFKRAGKKRFAALLVVEMRASQIVEQVLKEDVPLK